MTTQSQPKRIVNIIMKLNLPPTTSVLNKMKAFHLRDYM